MIFAPWSCTVFWFVLRIFHNLNFHDRISMVVFNVFFCPFYFLLLIAASRDLIRFRFSLFFLNLILFITSTIFLFLKAYLLRCHLYTIIYCFKRAIWWILANVHNWVNHCENQDVDHFCPSSCPFPSTPIPRTHTPSSWQPSICFVIDFAFSRILCKWTDSI